MTLWKTEYDQWGLRAQLRENFQETNNQVWNRSENSVWAQLDWIGISNEPNCE